MNNSYLKFQIIKIKEAKINSHNAHQRTIHLNNDFISAGLISNY